MPSFAPALGAAQAALSYSEILITFVGVTNADKVKIEAVKPAQFDFSSAMGDRKGSEEDLFAEYNTTEQSAPQSFASSAGDGPNESAVHLQQLVECAQRQELLLGKVGSLLVGLDAKFGRLTVTQERLEGSMQQLCSAGAGAAVPTASAVPVPTGSTRGSMIAPPGASSTIRAGPSPQEQQERIAAERARVEEEGRRRAEEMARKREDDERRRREEADPPKTSLGAVATGRFRGALARA